MGENRKFDDDRLFQILDPRYKRQSVVFAPPIDLTTKNNSSKQAAVKIKDKSSSQEQPLFNREHNVTTWSEETGENRGKKQSESSSPTVSSLLEKLDDYVGKGRENNQGDPGCGDASFDKGRITFDCDDDGENGARDSWGHACENSITRNTQRSVECRSGLKENDLVREKIAGEFEKKEVEDRANSNLRDIAQKREKHDGTDKGEGTCEDLAKAGDDDLPEIIASDRLSEERASLRDLNNEELTASEEGETALEKGGQAEEESETSAKKGDIPPPDAAELKEKESGSTIDTLSSHGELIDRDERIKTSSSGKTFFKNKEIASLLPRNHSGRMRPIEKVRQRRNPHTETSGADKKSEISASLSKPNPVEREIENVKAQNLKKTEENLGLIEPERLGSADKMSLANKQINMKMKREEEEAAALQERKQREGEMRKVEKELQKKEQRIEKEEEKKKKDAEIKLRGENEQARLAAVDSLRYEKQRITNFNTGQKNKYLEDVFGQKVKFDSFVKPGDILQKGMVIGQISNDSVPSKPDLMKFSANTPLPNQEQAESANGKVDPECEKMEKEFQKEEAATSKLPDPEPILRSLRDAARQSVESGIGRPVIEGVSGTIRAEAPIKAEAIGNMSFALPSEDRSLKTNYQDPTSCRKNSGDSPSSSEPSGDQMGEETGCHESGSSHEKSSPQLDSGDSEKSSSPVHKISRPSFPGTRRVPGAPIPGEVPGSLSGRAPAGMSESDNPDGNNQAGGRDILAGLLNMMMAISTGQSQGIPMAGNAGSRNSAGQTGCNNGNPFHRGMVDILNAARMMGAGPGQAQGAGMTGNPYQQTQQQTGSNTQNNGNNGGNNQSDAQPVNTDQQTQDTRTPTTPTTTSTTSTTSGSEGISPGNSTGSIEKPGSAGSLPPSGTGALESASMSALQQSENLAKEVIAEGKISQGAGVAKDNPYDDKSMDNNGKDDPQSDLPSNPEARRRREKAMAEVNSNPHKYIDQAGIFGEKSKKVEVNVDGVKPEFVPFDLDVRFSPEKHLKEGAIIDRGQKIGHIDIEAKQLNDFSLKEAILGMMKKDLGDSAVIESDGDVKCSSKRKVDTLDTGGQLTEERTLFRDKNLDVPNSFELFMEGQEGNEYEKAREYLEKYPEAPDAEWVKEKISSIENEESLGVKRTERKSPYSSPLLEEYRSLYRDERKNGSRLQQPAGHK